MGETELLIQKLTKLEHGDLYAIKMKPLEVSWAKDYRFDLGYFYVQEDQILRVDSDAILPDEPEKLEQFLTEQGVIVCQAEEIPDPNPEERDVHDFLAIDEGLRVFRSYNNQVETGYYETIFWEKNIGLVRYRSGFGAGASSMDLQLKQLGGWRKLLPLRSKAAERDIWKSYME